MKIPLTFVLFLLLGYLLTLYYSPSNKFFLILKIQILSRPFKAMVSNWRFYNMLKCYLQLNISFNSFLFIHFSFYLNIIYQNLQVEDYVLCERWKRVDRPLKVKREK